MRISKLGWTGVPLFAALALSALPASAQEPPPARPAPAGERDGARFRGAISAGGGGLFLAGFGLGLGGVDGRMGVQLNNLIGIYAQPQFSFGAGKVAGITAFTGTAGADAMVDFTLLDQIFVGAGGGGGIIGSAAGGDLHIRFGGYPVMSHGENGIRRKGLMLGVDAKVYFIAGITVLQPMLNIGYEAF